MGLTETTIAEIKEIRLVAREEFHRIEADHAEMMSDERGDYVAISTFPREREQWASNVAAKLVAASYQMGLEI